MLQNIAAAKQHLYSHVKYPATKQDIESACNYLADDFSPADKDWLKYNLPDQTYNAPQEVFAALRI